MVTRDPTMETPIASDIHWKWINTKAFCEQNYNILKILNF